MARTCSLRGCVFGSEDYLSGGGNENSIMQYDDPLQYASKLRLRAFDASM